MIYQKFNYVFFSYHGSIWKFQLSDLFCLNNVRIMEIKRNKTSAGIGFQFTPVFSVENPLAYSNIKNASLTDDFFNKEFPVRRPIIFFFEVSWYIITKSTGFDFFKKLREIYPDCKFVGYVLDIVYIYQRDWHMFVNLDEVRDIHKFFDCIITYNPMDAVNYGLTHYEGFYSSLPYKTAKDDKITTDVFFIAVAKDRLNKILNVYESLTDSGLNCDFWITGVPPEQQKYSDKIHYNLYVPYEQIILRDIQARGILEITQGGNYGLTMRFYEALLLNKNFITDNGYLNQEKFIGNQKIFYIDNWRNFKIDKEKYLAASKLSNNYSGEYSPLHLLSWLESYFNR